MKRRLNAQPWGVLLGMLIVMFAPFGTLAQYVPSDGDFVWASYEAAAYGLSTEDVLWMLENGKTQSEIETALRNARPPQQTVVGAKEFRELGDKWRVPPSEVIDAYRTGLEIGVNPDAYLYCLAYGRDPQAAQAVLRRHADAKKAVRRLGDRGAVDIPGSLETRYSASPCTLEDRRSAVARAIASVYGLPTYDNPEIFVLELLRKGLSSDEALAVVFALDCAWEGEPGSSSSPWNGDVLSLSSDQLRSESGEMADKISLSTLWEKESHPV